MESKKPLPTSPGFLWGALALFGAAVTLTACNSTHETPSDILSIGFSYSKSPYVCADPPFEDTDYDVHRSGLGFEIDVVRAVLEPLGYDFRPVYLPYDELNPALAAGRLDAAATVRPEVASAFYSEEFDAFHNYAITRPDSKPPLEHLEDLARRNVVAWEGAKLDLGPEFAEAVARAASYRELGNQHSQVQLFFEGQVDTLVIDNLIFRFFAKQAGEDPEQFEFHDILAPSTAFKVGFASESLRDDFDQGLAALRKSGEYERIVRSYTDR